MFILLPYSNIQPLAAETYKLMRLLYPNDEHIYVLYAGLLWNGKTKNRDVAKLLYQKALELKPNGEKVKQIPTAMKKALLSTEPFMTWPGFSIGGQLRTAGSNSGRFYF
jgi:hypothetical protein